MKVKPFITEETGKIFGDVIEINPEELYIKPIYNYESQNICYYAVCSNLNNVEVELCKYGDTEEIKGIPCARDMIEILFLHKYDTEPFAMLNQQEVIQWHKGINKLCKAIKESK